MSIRPREGSSHHFIDNPKCICGSSLFTGNGNSWPQWLECTGCGDIIWFKHDTPREKAIQEAVEDK